MKKVTILFLVLYFSCVFCLKGQDSLIDEPRFEQKIDTTGLTEAAAYKMLYENQLKSNEAILKTIFYALGGLGTAIISVFAGNWWFNEKKVKDLAKGINSQIAQGRNDAIAEVRQKMNSMSRQKTSEINNAVANLTKEANLLMTNLTSKFSEFSERTREEIKSDNKALNQVFDERLKSYSDNYSMLINTLEKQVTIRTDGLEERNATLEKSMNEKINKKFNSLDSKLTTELNNIDRSLHLNSAQLAETRNSFNIAFREYLEVAVLDSKFESPLLEFSLYGLNVNLQKAEYIWEDEEQRLQELLKEIKGSDETKKAISDRLKSIKIESFS